MSAPVRQVIATLTLLRVRSGRTQLDVADRIGLTKAAICQYENGKRAPSLAVLMEWADAPDADITVTRRRAPLPPLGNGRNFRGVSRKFHAAMRSKVTTA